MVLPINFAAIWKKYHDLSDEGDEGRRSTTVDQAGFEREMLAAGVTRDELADPAFQQQMNTALGAPTAPTDQGAQGDDVPGSDGQGNPVWINSRLKTERPRNVGPGAGTAPAGKGDQAKPGGGTAPSTTTPVVSGSTTTATPPTTGTSGKALSITRGQYDDFSAQARSVMSRLGITSREVTDAEIVQFAQAGLSADGITQFFSNLAEFVAQQPGLPFGMSKQQYEDTRTQMEKDTAAIDDTTPSGTAASTEPGYLKEALKEHMSASELQAGLADQNKRLGMKPPTKEDVSSIRTRPTMTTEEDRAGAATTRTGLGPTQDLGGAAAVSPFGRRR